MQKDILIQFGKRLRELRKKNNLTQVELSELAGFDRNYIGMLERGERNPALLNIQKIIQVFNLTLSEFFKEIENNNG
ncbi:MAG TPA: helix-turn-helix domain-containing protein [Candidatus Kapabacteria bacterium]|nr:helix-turn-helix domain-containing protein [Candidatus Kapabacteria bacterium]HPO61762.1 helix-turn-helix domain-containing protein [Candidatus Kapabacteria bacterium]